MMRISLSGLLPLFTFCATLLGAVQLVDRDGIGACLLAWGIGITVLAEVQRSRAQALIGVLTLRVGWKAERAIPPFLALVPDLAEAMRFHCCRILLTLGKDKSLCYTKAIMSTIENYLDRYLDPVTQAFSPEVAQRILELKPEQGILARVEELGQKSNSGDITDAERDEYQSLADAGTIVALLKAKARRFLAQSSA